MRLAIIGKGAIAGYVTDAVVTQPDLSLVGRVLRQPQVRSVIVGVGRHAVPNLRMAELQLDDADLNRIGAVLARSQEVPGDVYELERDREGRHGRIMRYDLHED